MDKKKLIEKRNELKEKMMQIITSAEAESRCITEEEQTEFDRYRDEIANIDSIADELYRRIRLANSNYSEVV